MDGRVYQSRNFQFAREIKSNNARVHPDDQENNPISINSADSNPSSKPVS